MITKETMWAFKPAIRKDFKDRLKASIEWARNRTAQRDNETSPPEPPTKYSNVYIFECEGFTKIGHATDPLARLTELQVGNPFTIHILGIIPTPKAFQEECALHAKFSQYRSRGEWFKLPEDVQSELVHHAFLCFENFQKLQFGKEAP